MVFQQLKSDISSLWAQSRAIARARRLGRKGAMSLSIEFVISAVVFASLLPTFFNSWTGLTQSANLSPVVKTILELTPLLIGVGVLYYYAKKAGVNVGGGKGM